MSRLLWAIHPSGIPKVEQSCLAALRCLSSRGPGGEGVYQGPQVFMGHRRASLGPECDEPQPLASLNGQVALAIYDVLRAEFLEMLGSRAFAESGIWSPECRTLVQRWYEQLVCGKG
jgi:asparagine synthetase B (glutamine-hydrolysing)